MVREFEGRTEKEAIDNAVSALGLDRDEFDVEIVESQSGFFFKRGKVKIRVHVEEDETESEYNGSPEPEGEFEEKLIRHLETIIGKMGYPGTARVQFRRDKKLGLTIDSDSSSILIGRKGKNLDALQLLLNVYAGRLTNQDIRIVIDSEDYRSRREETLTRLAQRAADQVRRTRRSKLLEPMNPFERRLVHTALSGLEDIETKSEGDGLYKQVRVLYKGKSQIR
jgi:spoIIIJ-associated protein